MAKPKLEAVGTVHVVGELVTIGKFQKREIVIMIDEMPLPISAQYEAMREAVEGLQVGDEVKCLLEVEGRYWASGNKYFSGFVLKEIEVLHTYPSESSDGHIPEENFDPTANLPF